MGDIDKWPRPIEVNLNNDLNEINPDESLVSVEGSYQNPFSKGSSDPFSRNIKMPNNDQALTGAGDAHDELKIKNDSKNMVIKRKFKIEMDRLVVSSIETYRTKYDQYLKLNNNTSNKQVWKVYDHITADLFNEMLAEIMGTIDKDLD